MNLLAFVFDFFLLFHIRLKFSTANGKILRSNDRKLYKKYFRLVYGNNLIEICEKIMLKNISRVKTK